jgi:tetratricopeptide (TPR) repeat protein
VYYASIHQESKALSCFDSAIYVRFSYIEAYIEKAKTLQKTNRFREAISTLEKAATINNNLPEAYILMGECYEKLHESDLAIQAYEQALMYDPENEIAIEKMVNDPIALEKFKSQQADAEVMTKEQIEKKLKQSNKQGASAGFTATLSTLALLILATLYSLLVTIIYRRIVFRS